MTDTASERAYQALRRSIIARQRRPGDVLSRSVLATELGTSQTPVREALLRLEREGFIRVKPQAATVVAPISVSSVHQAAFLRRSLEQNVVRRLARRNNAVDLGDLRHTPPQNASADELAGTDRLFHRGLFRRVGMTELFDATLPLLAPLDRCRALQAPTPEHVARIHSEHQDVLQRIEAGDPDGAAAAMTAHLSQELAELGQWQADHPTMFEEG
ncbi:MAG: GntR family transcriptional regulator [Pseudomonadota bacterium]